MARIYCSLGSGIGRRALEFCKGHGVHEHAGGASGASAGPFLRFVELFDRPIL